MIVVDANVAAKWYLPEIGTEAALELMGGPNRLFAPDLIRIEVLGSLKLTFMEISKAAAEAMTKKGMKTGG